MCGIVGYAGSKQAAPILLDGLSKLEYRGYDSAGICVRDGASDPVVVRAKGRLQLLAEKTDNGNSLKGTTGIGHTRWATHGEPSENNAHPHTANGGEVVAVHNGIIENYQELKDKLIHKGYTFYSDTDTEVVVNLIDYYNRKYRVSPIDAIAKTMVRVRGSYALVVMFRDHPGEIFAAAAAQPSLLVPMALHGLITGFAAFVLYTNGLRFLETGQASVVASLELVFGALVGLIAYGESVSADALAGIALILGAVSILSIAEKK